MKSVSRADLVGAHQIGTPRWYAQVNDCLARRRNRGPTEPLLAGMADAIDVEDALATGLRSDGRHLAVNVLVIGDTNDGALALNIVFTRGRFRVGPGWVRHCDAVARLDLETARRAFRCGTDDALANAVMDGRATAAGSWDALNFLRVHLVPADDHELRAATA